MGLGIFDCNNAFNERFVSDYMSILSEFHPFFGNGVFSTDKIMELIKAGDISWEDLTEEQIQPNTIDVRIGEVRVYNCNSRQVSPDKVEPDAVYAGEKDEPIVIPSRSFAEIDVYDKIRFDSDKYIMDIELRSGRGRLQLTPSANMNFMNVGMGNGMNVFNMNPNDIVLYGQDRFAQAFFNSSNGTSADGQIINNPDEIRAIAERCGVGNIGPYLKLMPGKKILKYKEIGGIDTRKKYSHEELFEERGLPYRIGSCEQVLMQSAEEINVPNNIGVRLLRRFPTIQQSCLTGPDIRVFTPLRFVVNSGWVDSGYKGKIMMQPLARLECILGEIEPTCLGIVYKYDKDISKPYDGNYTGGKILNS